ncbi:hypothetical protein LINPERHAP1_LOCUS21169 [Linum perenne]
MGGGSEENS